MEQKKCRNFNRPKNRPKVKFRPLRIRQTYKFIMYINEKDGGRTWARTKDPLIKS